MEKDNILDKKPPIKKHYHGHRERLRERFKKVGYLGFHDYELLEMVLCLCIPRGDVKPIAKDLLQRFKTLENVLHADEVLLSEIKGLGEGSIHGLKVILSIHQRITQMNIHKRNILDSLSEILQYCYTHMAFERVEEIRILYLDAKMGLIHDDIHQRGTVDESSFYIAEVAKKSLDLGASGIVIIHNHPSGSPTPSMHDKVLTQELIEALSPLSIVVHDHIIIGKEGFYSLKMQKDI